MSGESPDGLERIWTPHRMAYVRAAVDDEGCPFCSIPGHPDEESLVVARGEATYAVLNLHPYNPGPPDGRALPPRRGPGGAHGRRSPPS